MNNFIYPSCRCHKNYLQVLCAYGTHNKTSVQKLVVLFIVKETLYDVYSGQYLILIYTVVHACIEHRYQ